MVVHGTDTMAYTASALSLMLLGFRKPIVMTGGQCELTSAASLSLSLVILTCIPVMFLLSLLFRCFLALLFVFC